MVVTVQVVEARRRRVPRLLHEARLHKHLSGLPNVGKRRRAARGKHLGVKRSSSSDVANSYHVRSLVQLEPHILCPYQHCITQC